MKKFFLSSTLIFCLSLVGTAQVSSETTIDEKFAELISNSNNFKGHKVVNSEELTTLQRLTSNRIAELKEEIAASKQAAQAQKEKMIALQEKLDSLEASLKEVTAEKDAIAFLGMPVDKGTYKTIMWSIVGLLVLALTFFVIRFKKSHVHTAEARKNLAEMEKEFEAYRAKALEKEQRLGRLLQDEKNKHMKVAK